VQPSRVIQTDFDRLAAVDEDNWNHNNHYHAHLLRHLPPHCAQSLDVGCGTGAFARLLAGRSAHVLALDLSPEMIRVAQDRSAAYPNVTYQVTDVLAWDFPPERFDCVASIATFHHLPMEPMLAAIMAALKPGGVLLILDLYQAQGWGERLDAGLVMSASLALRLLHNGRIRESEAARQAWAAHGEHDVYLRIAQVREICSRLLPGATVTRHLFWRYSIVWHKPQ
jgi:2-polyprenyl-3-methyl-5-hydroxy-6-metoxy-1,4-benzoquinol methylase